LIHSGRGKIPAPEISDGLSLQVTPQAGKCKTSRAEPIDLPPRIG